MYVTIMHQPVTVSSNTRSQMHVQVKHFLAHLQNLIPTLAGIIVYIRILYHLKWRLNLVDVLENGLFVHAFGYMCLS